MKSFGVLAGTSSEIVIVVLRLGSGEHPSAAESPREALLGASLMVLERKKTRLQWSQPNQYALST